MENANIQAMPPLLKIRVNDNEEQFVNYADEGMTKRETMALYFASNALAGMMANQNANPHPDNIANIGVSYADALLKALKTKNPA